MTKGCQRKMMIYNVFFLQIWLWQDFRLVYSDTLTSMQISGKGLIDRSYFQRSCSALQRGQVVELLHSLGKSGKGLAITCLKSVLCGTGKRACLVCKDFLIQNMDSATPYTEPLLV
ncbi:hypothetical protein NC651_018286 [Populus alba x Populus x berolinensis]|nr:hypothetical protein NC651_018286 [Populus alba x Populus x berolinensis]